MKEQRFITEEISHTEYIFRIANWDPCTRRMKQLKYEVIPTKNSPLNTSSNKLEETALPSTSQENTIILQFDVD